MEVYHITCNERAQSCSERGTVVLQICTDAVTDETGSNSETSSHDEFEPIDIEGDLITDTEEDEDPVPVRPRAVKAKRKVSCMLYVTCSLSVNPKGF
jgi:hypothetical protein